jgi:hypothetical protein
MSDATDNSVSCQPHGCREPITLTDASSLLWQLKNLYHATTSVASDATEYWADIAVKSKSPMAPLANIPGGFAALWTPGVAPTTALTLGTAGFGFVNVPRSMVHFTTAAGRSGILGSGLINSSTNLLKNALFGPGVYLARIGRPINLFISEKSLIPIVISTPAGTARIIPYLVYVRWGIAPLAVDILNK